jgi:hypothetical protein
MMSTAGFRILPISILISLSVLTPRVARAGDDYPIVLDEMKQREGKALFKATWGRGGASAPSSMSMPTASRNSSRWIGTKTGFRSS